MTWWSELVESEPEFAERVRSRFAVRKHGTMATVRRDGSPRISGTEFGFSAGQVRLGCMAGSVKAQDLRRDPRVALHCPTEDASEQDPSGWPGDAKISGVAHEESPGEDGSHRFRVELTAVVLTRVGDPPDHLLIESWHPGRGLVRRLRR
ncbi:pyridoxamine 5'-phosphate oxidase family protein [Micromonospora sp. SH-82]|uniref:pyridoxamine 5'-phosphate oxidase family protein n=1 Tax=Micromonospora sp. SH-82 TaxID=3132938 RepID=UPI003EBA8EFF